MKTIVIDPVKVATKLAQQKIEQDLVGNAVPNKESLYKKDGDYKTWVFGLFTEEYEYFFKLLTDFHEENLIKDR